MTLSFRQLTCGVTAHRSVCRFPTGRQLARRLVCSTAGCGLPPKKLPPKAVTKGTVTQVWDATQRKRPRTFLTALFPLPKLDRVLCPDRVLCAKPGRSAGSSAPRLESQRWPEISLLVEAPSLRGFLTRILHKDFPQGSLQGFSTGVLYKIFPQGNPDSGP